MISDSTDSSTGSSIAVSSVMETESALLLRDAATVARAAWVDGSQVVTYRVAVKGAGAWLLDSKGELRNADDGEANADLQLTYATDDVFTGLAYK